MFFPVCSEHTVYFNVCACTIYIELWKCSLGDKDVLWCLLTPSDWVTCVGVILYRPTYTSRCKRWCYFQYKQHWLIA